MKCKKRVNEYSFSAKGVWPRLLILLFLSLLIAVFSVLNAASLKLLLDIASGESSITILTGSLLALFVIAFKAFLDSFDVLIFSIGHYTQKEFSLDVDSL